MVLAGRLDAECKRMKILHKDDFENCSMSNHVNGYLLLNRRIPRSTFSAKNKLSPCFLVADSNAHITECSHKLVTFVVH